jgi:hypothetical protein
MFDIHFDRCSSICPLSFSSFIVSFAKAVDDKELRSSLKKWDEFVPENGDTGEHLLAFFNSG